MLSSKSVTLAALFCLVASLSTSLVGSVAAAQTAPLPPQPINPVPQIPTEGPKPPQPIEDSVLRYSQIRPRFDQGIKTSQAQLTGSWRAVASATTLKCGPKLKDAAKSTGLKNADGSPLFGLEFGQHETTGLPGDAAQSVFGVTISGIGDKKTKQGPYKANEEEPQFATWSYPKKTDVFYSWACRADATNAEMLLCAVTLIDGSKRSANKCSDDQGGILVVYRKLKAI